MSKLYEEFLRHILAECNWLESQLAVGLQMDEFLKDETLKRAAVRSLEIIGEASKKFRLTRNFAGPESHGKIWQECGTV